MVVDSSNNANTEIELHDMRVVLPSLLTLEKWIQARYGGEKQWRNLPRSATSQPSEYATSPLSRDYLSLQQANGSRELDRNHSLSRQYASCDEPQPLSQTSSVPNLVPGRQASALLNIER
jgi:hypothetical protein